MLIDKVEGAAERAGLNKGDVIVAVGQQDATDPVQASAIINRYEAGKQIALLVKRGEQAVWLVVRAPSK